MWHCQEEGCLGLAHLARALLPLKRPRLSAWQLRRRADGVRVCYSVTTRGSRGRGIAKHRAILPCTLQIAIEHPTAAHHKAAKNAGDPVLQMFCQKGLGTRHDAVHDELHHRPELKHSREAPPLKTAVHWVQVPAAAPLGWHPALLVQQVSAHVPVHALQPRRQLQQHTLLVDMSTEPLQPCKAASAPRTSIDTSALSCGSLARQCSALCPWPSAAEKPILLLMWRLRGRHASQQGLTACNRCRHIA